MAEPDHSVSYEIPQDALRTARQCRHYSMCKIDYLGTGLCPAGKEKHFVSYYPQGRMDLVRALGEGKLALTPRLIDVADSCTLCGVCDLQCHFITELRPLSVMKALKEYVEQHRVNGNSLLHEKSPRDEDPLLVQLQEVVGPSWVSNDPAITLAYSSDPSTVMHPRVPRVVVLPESAQEVQAIFRVIQNRKIPFMVRGNGSSVMGFALTEGVLIDTQRMKTLEFDSERWFVKVGAGVSAFELQKEALARGYRVNVAEPAALVCANLMSSGIMSLFSTAYGTLDENYVDAEFVSKEGERFTFKEHSDFYRFHREERLPAGICTSAQMKLYPITKNEEGFLVPADHLRDALVLVRELSARRIGFGLGVLGADYLTTFMSPQTQLAREVKELFKRTLQAPWMVLVLGDEKDRAAVEHMNRTILSNDLFRTLMLGISKLSAHSSDDSLAEILDSASDSEGRPLIHLLGRKDLQPLVEMALQPSPENLATAVPEDLRADYIRLYRRPEMTDLVWLNMFRILSSRMGREKHLLPLILYVPLDQPAMIERLVHDFGTIADSFHLKRDFGFVAPLDFGKRAFLEYDFYYDQNDPEEVERAQRALGGVAQLVEKTSASAVGVQWIWFTLNQGSSRKENVLYAL